MKKLFDPVSNAKIIGFLLILMGIIEPLQYLTHLISTNESTQLSPTSLQSLIFAIAYLIIGIGLRKTKLWAMYGFLGLALAGLLVSMNYYFRNQGAFLLLYLLIGNGIPIALSIWFYSAKNRFNK